MNICFRIKYGTFDILQDEEVRQGLKTFSNWPTYPQVYVMGDLIGGLDILKVCESSCYVRLYWGKTSELQCVTMSDSLLPHGTNRQINQQLPWFFSMTSQCIYVPGSIVHNSDPHYTLINIVTHCSILSELCVSLDCEVWAYNVRYE